MSVFSAAEIAYLQEQTLGRLATADAEGRPHVIPVTFHFNAEEDAIDVGGVDFTSGNKWRDMQEPRIVAWGIDAPGYTPEGLRTNARSVG